MLGVPILDATPLSFHCLTDGPQELVGGRTNADDTTIKLTGESTQRFSSIQCFSLGFKGTKVMEIWLHYNAPGSGELLRGKV